MLAEIYNISTFVVTRLIEFLQIINVRRNWRYIEVQYGKFSLEYVEFFELFNTIVATFSLSSKIWFTWKKHFIISVTFLDIVLIDMFLEDEVGFGALRRFFRCLTSLKKAFHLCRKNSTIVKEHSFTFSLTFFYIFVC